MRGFVFQDDIRRIAKVESIPKSGCKKTRENDQQ